MRLSVFSDETDLDLSRAIPVIKKWNLKYVDLRSLIFQKPFEDLSDEQLMEVRKMLDDNGLKVACLQSSLAKVHLPEPERLNLEMKKLDRIIRASEILDCRLVRSFFFWQPPNGQEGKGIGDLAVRPDVLAKVMQMFLPFAEKARKAGLILAFENCGCTKEECFRMIEALDIPGWEFAWDPKNSWMHDKEERENDLDSYLDRMARKTNCVHVKSTGTIWFADHFDEIPYEKVFQALENVGFDGPVSLETHNFNPKITNVEACGNVLEVVRRAWPSAAPGAQQETCAIQSGNLVREYAADPVRFGVIGLGMGYNRAAEMMKTSGIRLVQVCDLLEDRRKRAAEAFHVPATRNCDELLANPDIEAVMVLNETGNHCRLAEKVLHAGKPVLLTKPMDMSVAACDRLIALAKEKHLLLGLDHCRRLRPSVQSLKAAHESGFFGRPLSASVTLKVNRTMEYFREN